jgi:CheY-like chemotaxis protein
VDDDPLVCEGTAAMIEDLGHAVVEASSAEAALRLLETTPDIDVVITDHAMPGMTGLELAHEIRERYPDVPVVLATGYAEVKAGSFEGLPRLSKPFTQRSLAEVIALVFRRSRTRQRAMSD